MDFSIFLFQQNNLSFNFISPQVPLYFFWNMAVHPGAGVGVGVFPIPEFLDNALLLVLYYTHPLSLANSQCSIFNLNLRSKAIGFLCFHHFPQTTITCFWLLLRTILSPSLWFHLSQCRAPWVFKCAENSDESKAKPHFVTQSEKRWPNCHHSCIIWGSWTARGNRCYREIHQSVW